MNEEDFKNLLSKHNQQHLIFYYHNLNEDEQKEFRNQIAHVNWEYIDNFKKNKFNKKRGKLKPLKALSSNEISKNTFKYEANGLQAIKNGQVAAVLLAGGQGSRLGFEGPKGAYNIGIKKDKYIFELLIENIKSVSQQAQTYIFFYIMTSPGNYDATVKFFEDHNYFNYPKQYVTFFKQEVLPAIDFEGNLLMNSPKDLCLSPNGNGGWFDSIIKSGLLDSIQNNGIKWMNVFSVDNVLQKIADPIFIGATIDSNCVCGAKVIKKASPQEKVGVLCLEDDKPSVVEYTEMTEEMISSYDPDGELSFRFGVILNYLFNIEALLNINSESFPIHLAKKKINNYNATGEYIKPEKENGYKFELLILDMIHQLDNCLPYEVIREDEFAPVKNLVGVDSVESARYLLKNNGFKL